MQGEGQLVSQAIQWLPIALNLWSVDCWTNTLNLHTDVIGHVNVQNCLLIIFKYQPSSLQISCLSVEQPIRFSLGVVCASLGISITIEDNSNVFMPLYGSQLISLACL